MHRSSTAPVITKHLIKTLLPRRSPSQRFNRMGLFFSRAATTKNAAQQEDDLYLLVGLGNPGPRYQDTRHNVGFMAVDALAGEMSVSTDRLQNHCAVGRGRLFDRKVLLAKPMRFMNTSGEGVAPLAKYYGIPPERVLVVYDDLDSASGTVRLRLKGGHGGHNGMRSIIQHVGTQEFPRVKVGIGRPSEGVPVVEYVLQDFSKAERERIDVAVKEALDTAKAWLVLGGEKAASGVRVDADGQPVAPKTVHKNGKGVKQTSKKQLPVVMAVDGANADGGGGGSPSPPPPPQQQQQPQQPQSAMAAAIAAATAGKST